MAFTRVCNQLAEYLASTGDRRSVNSLPVIVNSIPEHLW